MLYPSCIAVAALALGLAPGCFYLEPINDKPVARITELTDEPYFRGKTVEFDAAKSEDDGRNLIAHWNAYRCSDAVPPQCEALDGIDEVVKDQLADPYELRLDPAMSLATSNEIFVELEVEDEHGARGRDSISFIVQNGLPTIEIQDQPGALDPRPGGGWVLGIPLHVAVRVTDDDESVDIDVEYRVPIGGGSDPTNVIFELETEPGNETSYLFGPDVPGIWEIHVTADDGNGGVAEQTKPILIEPDHAPCIALTDPVAVATASYIVERSEGPRRFAVLSVSDALDVYPLSPGLPAQVAETRFTWKIATPDTGGSLVDISGHTAPDYVLDPTALSPGDEVILQVEARDRVDRTFCPADEPTCSIDGDNCFQRLTWGVEIR